MFNRLELLIGKNNVEILSEKHVLVVGIGGVGGYALEGLVRSGIGNITIIDYDVIDISNLNRQIITNINNVGNFKVDEAIKRAKDINPDINIIGINAKLDLDNLNNILTSQYDFIIDACDDIKVKIALIKYGINNKVKTISCMGTANKLHPELLKISTLDKTEYDPIARLLRKEFKDQKIPVIYSQEQPLRTEKPLGSTAFVPGTAGLLCVSYVINQILIENNPKII